MPGYEIIPIELEKELDIDNLLRQAEQLDDPVVTRIEFLWRANNETWELFYRLHKDRKDPAHMGLLGVAKLARAKRDAYAELLQEIVAAAIRKAEQERNHEHA
jgi:hypothetical protein